MLFSEILMLFSQNLRRLKERLKKICESASILLKVTVTEIKRVRSPKIRERA